MISDIEIQNFLGYLEKNGNLKRLATNSDNNKAPVHRWFPFLVGFSHNLVRDTISYFKVDHEKYSVFDPFMGSGTTGVVGRELGVDVVGNEINRFLHRICKVKMSLPLTKNTEIVSEGANLVERASVNWRSVKLDSEHALLAKCFPTDNLKKLIAIRELIFEKYNKSVCGGYFFVALTKALTRSSSFGINVPYVSWLDIRVPGNPFELFKHNLQIMSEDLANRSMIKKQGLRVKVYLHDSRVMNQSVGSKSIDMIFTSPPYLNNFDYGEALKVFLYFWKLARNFNEITKNIRRVSVASATTYYKERSYSSRTYEEIMGENLLNTIPHTAELVIGRAREIREEITRRTNPQKSFDLLTVLYFRDMFLAFQELRRVLKDESLCFIIVGDSAHYGVYVPTDSLLGEMAIELGFSSYTLRTIRARGMKWRTLKYRHNKQLRESILILRR